MKRCTLFLSLVALLGVSACTRAAGTAATTAPAQPAPAAPTQTAAAFDGAGLTQSACTTCHDLSAITSNPGAYSESDFRALVERMVGYGAPVAQDQVEPLVGYLTATYGP